MIRIIIAATLCLAVLGCANISYYAQATEGQMQLMAAARPIPEVLKDPATDPGLRRQLEQVPPALPWFGVQCRGASREPRLHSLVQGRYKPA